MKDTKCHAMHCKREANYSIRVCKERLSYCPRHAQQVYQAFNRHATRWTARREIQIARKRAAMKNYALAQAQNR